VSGRAAALGGATGVQELEAVGRLLVERHVRVAEDHEIGAFPEAAPHPLEAAGARSGVVQHRDANALHLHHPLHWQQATEIGAVHVPMDAGDRRADGLEVAQHVGRGEIARVEQEVRPRDPLDAGVREPPGAPR
jgi:hypothetical protein